MTRVFQCLAILLAFLFSFSFGQLPEPWQNEDIGFVDVPGSAEYSDGVFTVSGSGGIWDTDAFHYVYQVVSGDEVELIAHLDEYDTELYEWTKVGIMFRASNDPFSRNVFLFSASGYGICMQGRPEDYGQPVWYSTYGGDPYPKWMRLRKEGNMVHAYVSDDGVEWNVVRDSIEINLEGEFLVGLAVTSTWPDTAVEAKFSGVEVVVGGNSIEELADAKVCRVIGLVESYPNPFNPMTNIRFRLNRRSDVSIKIYDLLGCEVRELVNSSFNAGSHSVVFDGSDLSTGVYIYKVQASIAVKSGNRNQFSSKLGVGT